MNMDENQLKEMKKTEWTFVYVHDAIKEAEKTEKTIEGKAKKIKELLEKKKKEIEDEIQDLEESVEELNGVFEYYFKEG